MRPVEKECALFENILAPNKRQSIKWTNEAPLKLLCFTCAPPDTNEWI